jgi:hypothetical protein
VEKCFGSSGSPSFFSENTTISKLEAFASGLDGFSLEPFGGAVSADFGWPLPVLTFAGLAFSAFDFFSLSYTGTSAVHQPG